jgi:hypothetical protein
MLRNPISKGSLILISLGVLALAAMTLTLKPKAAQADERHGDLHLIKNCSAFTFLPGSYCMITDSNLSEITNGSKIYYDQPAPVAPVVLEGGLDSNVVLYVDTGDWAVGRCTLDGITNLGLCTFSDGTGKLTGFQARLDVSSTDGINYSLDGTYSFSRDHDRDHE